MSVAALPQHPFPLFPSPSFLILSTLLLRPSLPSSLFPSLFPSVFYAATTSQPPFLFPSLHNCHEFTTLCHTE